MEENKINFFAIPAFSFVPPKYNKLIKESAGKIFGALLICFLIMALITAVKVNLTLTDVGDEIRANCPDFSLVGGEFEIEQSYSIDEDGVYIVIDDSLEDVTEDDIREVVSGGNYQSAIILGKYSFAMYSNGQFQARDYSEFDGLTFSKDSLLDKFIPLIKNVVFIAILLGAFFSIGLYYFVALIVQLFTMMFEKIFGVQFDGVERYRTTVLAKFPVHVLVFVLGLFNVNIGMWINLVLQIAFIAVVMFMFKKANESDVQMIEDNTYVE